MGRRKIIQRGAGNDLFVFMHIEPESAEVAAQAARVTDDTVIAEVWGVGTSAYRLVMPAYGGWQKYVAGVAAEVGRPGFEHACLTTWSAGSQIIKTVCRVAPHYWPDAIVSLDGLYGTKPPGSRPGDGNVVLDAELDAVCRYAVAAARGERTFVLLHSSIGTPYGSSGECAHLIRFYVEQNMGRPMEIDESVTPADLDNHAFSEALVLGNFHLLEFPGRDAKEHMREAHLFDEVWRKWIPWAKDGAAPPTAAVEPPVAPATPPAAPAPTAIARVLRRGDEGEDVRAVQVFLRGWGMGHIVADGKLGPLSESAIKTFQRAAALTPDGVVGPKTIAAMGALGFAGAPAPENDPVGSAEWFPPRPSFSPLVGNAARARVFGRMEYVPAPAPTNPEAIRITNGWVRDNIVACVVPQLRGVAGAPASGTVYVHRLVAPRLQALFAAWETAGLLPLVKTFDGAWVPRFIRGSRTTLSNHAYGSAIDLNARWNALGTRGARRGELGSVRDLVPIANELGWAWGGHFVSSRPDPMHFELAVL